jgi:opacity protein-like surface antigen
MRALFGGIFSVAAILVAGTLSAQAADLIVDAPGVVEADSAVDWSGLYVGGSLGGAFATLSYDSPDAPETNYSADAEGLLAGVQIGYNWQMDGMVLGLQTDIAYLGGETDEGDSFEWLGSTTARLGFTVDNLLLYGKAGIAYGSGHLKTDYFGTPHEETNTHVGWTVGAGLEVALSDGFSAFVEYDYVDLGESNYFPNLFNAAGVNTDINAHIIKVGLNYQF